MRSVKYIYANYIIYGFRRFYKLAIVFLIIGVLLYVNEKKMEYKSKFNYLTFLIGKTKCNNDSF